MVSANDVAKYVLEKQGEMTTMKLQKLLYYCQAWSLVWDDSPLFEESIEAWINGPIIPNIYQQHRGLFKTTAGSWNGNSSNLSKVQKETVDAVLSFYGEKSSQWLSDLTHKEGPWLEARKGLADNERGSNVITHASMAEYYSSLQKIAGNE